MGQADLKAFQMGALKLLPELMERMPELLLHAGIIMVVLARSIVLMRHCNGIGRIVRRSQNRWDNPRGLIKNDKTGRGRPKREERLGGRKEDEGWFRFMYFSMYKSDILQACGLRWGLS